MGRHFPKTENHQRNLWQPQARIMMGESIQDGCGKLERKKIQNHSSWEAALLSWLIWIQHQMPWETPCPQSDSSRIRQANSVLTSPLTRGVTSVMGACGGKLKPGGDCNAHFSAHRHHNYCAVKYHPVSQYILKQTTEQEEEACNNNRVCAIMTQSLAEIDKIPSRRILEHWMPMTAWRHPRRRGSPDK